MVVMCACETTDLCAELIAGAVEAEDEGTSGMAGRDDVMIAGSGGSGMLRFDGTGGGCSACCVPDAVCGLRGCGEWGRGRLGVGGGCGHVANKERTVADPGRASDEVYIADCQAMK